MLWKVRAQEHYVESRISEKKSSLTMKKRLDEVVGPGLWPSVPLTGPSVPIAGPPFPLWGPFSCLLVGHRPQIFIA